jgi:hypothetical protein
MSERLRFLRPVSLAALGSISGLEATVPTLAGKQESGRQSHKRASRRAGEEVTISYGAWPNDIFFIFFGFVPERNPHDSVVLFDGLADVAAVHEGPGAAGEGQAADALTKLEEALGSGDWGRWKAVTFQPNLGSFAQL